MIKSKKFSQLNILLAIIMSVITIFSSMNIKALAEVKNEKIVEQQDIIKVVSDLINWKKKDVGSTSDGYLINEEFLKLAGTTPGDWFPIGLGRIKDIEGIEVQDATVLPGVYGGFIGYLANINNYVIEKYKKPGKLHPKKATEWHRISLAILSVGGDPRHMGAGEIDLIKDGTYNRVDENGKGILAEQGINGLIFGLISLDSGKFAIGEEHHYTRDDIIRNILSRQLKDGGFALTGKKSDVDITAMAVQSLAPYYNSEKEYSYKNKNLNASAETTKKVRTVIDECLAWLSSVQNADGDYSSWGTENVESTIQTAIALNSLGIDIFKDERFIKNGNTLYDGILKYRMKDGGFIHSSTYDPDNPSSLPDKSNSMASEQVLYALASVLRNMNGMRKLYDMRLEQSKEVKEQIEQVKLSIENLNESSTKEQVQLVYDEYNKIDNSEKEYVYNYKKLSDELIKFNIPFVDENLDYGSGELEGGGLMYEFSEMDKKKVDNLPDQFTTKWYTSVVQLLFKLNNSFDFEGKQSYKIKLEKAKNEIESIQKEIEDIKKEIKEKLYPFEWMNLDKRNMVHELYNRYDALSDYDKTLFEKSDIEGLKKCKTQVDNLFTALIISICMVVVISVLVVFIILHIKSRKRKKASLMMEESDE